MLDIYGIGIRLNLHAESVFAGLIDLGEQFEKLDLLVVGLNKSLKALGPAAVQMQGIVGAELVKLSVELENLDVLTGGLNTSLRALGLAGVEINTLSAETGTFGAEMARANEQALLLGRNLHSIRSAGMVPPIMPPGGVPGIVPLPGAGGGGRHNNHQGWHGGNVHAGTNGVGIGSVGYGLGADAAIPLIAVGAAAYGAHALYEADKDYEMAFARFKSLNLGDQVNAEADKFVTATRTYGASHTELMKAMGESVGLFGSFEEAAKYTPKLVTLGKANAAIFGEKGGHLDEEGQKSLIKFIDRRGGFKDEETFQRTLDLAEKMVTGSAGFLDFKDLGAFSQNAGTAFRSLSDEGLLRMEGLLIEQGGQKAGTALMSVYQNLVAGRTPVKTMHLLEELGIGHVTQHVTGTVGGKQSTSNKFDLSPLYSMMLQSDPAKFFGELLPKLLAKKGITKDADVLKAVNDILSNRNASNQGSIMTAQEFQVLRDFTLAKNAMGAKEVSDMFSKLPAGAEDDFIAAWKDFKSEFGKGVLPALTDMLKSGAGILRTIEDFERKHGEPVQKSVGSTSRMLLGPVKPLFQLYEATRDWFSNSGKPKVVASATDRWQPFGNDDPTGDSRYIAGGPKQPQQNVTNVYLDGKLIAQNVVDRAVQGMSSPASGLSGFDGRMGFQSPSMAR